MRKVKWIFFAYMAIVALIVCGIALSFAVLPQRDPEALFSTYGSNIRSLDPGKISDVPSAQIGGYIFECLYNYDYYKRPYTLVVGMRSWLFAAFRDLKRTPGAR